MTPCREWRGPRLVKGYGTKYNPLTKKRVLAHRWIWEQINGPIPDGMVIMHVCDNPPCYRYDHLRIGTQADNLADMRAKTRQNIGERNGSSKLTEDQVRAIHASTEPGVALVSKYGISKSQISAIRKGQRWSHLWEERGDG